MKTSMCTLLVAIAFVTFMPNVSLAVTCTSCADCESKLEDGYDVTLTQDISPARSGTACITLSSDADGTTLDCDEYDITGNNERGVNGIEIDGADDVTIEWCRLYDWGETAVGVSDPDEQGAIYLHNTTDSYISYNYIQGGRQGILVSGNYLQRSHGNIISDNTVRSPGYIGIGVWNYSYNNYISQNLVYDDSYGNITEYGMSTCFNSYINDIIDNDIEDIRILGFCFCNDAEDNELRWNRIDSESEDESYLDIQANGDNSGDYNTCYEVDIWSDDSHSGPGCVNPT